MTTITEALRAARACIQQDRTSLADTGMRHDNTMEPDAAAGVAEYDAVLQQIDAALAGMTNHITDEQIDAATKDIGLQSPFARYRIARAVLALAAPAPAVPSDEREANATARAFALATMAAEEFIRCNGLATGEADEFVMTGPDLTDEHAMACIDHLKWVGECVAFDCQDGVIVRLGDFTLGSLS